MKLTTTVVTVLLVLVVLTAFLEGQLSNIVQTATVLNFTNLVKAIRGANLVATLQGNGPFTVFAPTDAAFGKLPNGTIEELLKAENKHILVDLLKYHLIDRHMTAGNISSMSLPAQMKTLSGIRVIFNKGADKLKINSATVVTSDIMATNGIIHAIDTVLEPAMSKASSFDLKQGYYIMLLVVITFSYPLAA